MYGSGQGGRNWSETETKVILALCEAVNGESLSGPQLKAYSSYAKYKDVRCILQSMDIKAFLVGTPFFDIPITDVTTLAEPWAFFDNQKAPYFYLTSTSNISRCDKNMSMYI